MSAHQVAPSGQLTTRIIKPTSPEILVKDACLHPTLADVMRYDPKSRLGHAVKAILAHLPDTADARAAALDLIDRVTSCLVVESSLYGRILRPHPSYQLRRALKVQDLGLLGTKVVTTVGAGYIVDAFQNLVELENMKYHGLGTGSGAEAAADTALGTELTTEQSGNVRATGTTTEASALVYQTVATNTLDGTPGAALREHGVFNQAALGGGVLLDRTVFAAITLVSGDSLQTDYRLTFTAGS
jgi:hypothetical protein